MDTYDFERINNCAATGGYRCFDCGEWVYGLHHCPACANSQLGGTHETPQYVLRKDFEKLVKRVKRLEKP